MAQDLPTEMHSMWGYLLKQFKTAVSVEQNNPGGYSGPILWIARITASQRVQPLHMAFLDQEKAFNTQFHINLFVILV